MQPRRFMAMVGVAQALCDATGMHAVHATWAGDDGEDYGAPLRAAGGHLVFPRDGQALIDEHAVWLTGDEEARNETHARFDTTSPEARAIEMTVRGLAPENGMRARHASEPAPLDARALCKALCRATGKHAVYAEFDANEGVELRYASGGLLDPALDERACGEGRALALADSEDEAFALCEHLVGDDGPTSRNAYAGQARIHAMTLDANGRAITENT